MKNFFSDIINLGKTNKKHSTTITSQDSVFNGGIDHRLLKLRLIINTISI